MKYSRILSYVQSNLWAIAPDKLHEIVSVLAFRAAGHEFTPEEIRARLGDSLRERTDPAAVQGGGVGILPIRGTIAHRMGNIEESSGGTSCEAIAAGFRQLLANSQVSTIVLDVDSPGGTVTGVQELAAEIYRGRGAGTKKIVAVTNGLNASAAYWIASQADEIVSIPSGITGSIGVFTAHADLSKALEKEGIDVTLISAGKYKTEGNPYEPLSDDAKAILQARVDEAYRAFTADVARGRGVSAADVRNGFGEGRAVTAKDAKAAGLVDRIATMDETLSRLLSGGGRSSGARADIEDVPVLAAAESAAEIERRYRSL